MTTTTAVKQELPPGVVPSDLKYPKYDSDDKMVRDVGDHGSITFYQVDGRRAKFWCIATLFIGRGRNHADRTYGVTLDGNLVRVGKGPHVKQTLQVYIRQSRVKALQKYVDLYTKGLGDAGQVRDRISSRRAQGQLERAAGNRSWRWDM